MRVRRLSSFPNRTSTTDNTTRGSSRSPPNGAGRPDRRVNQFMPPSLQGGTAASVRCAQRQRDARGCREEKGSVGPVPTNRVFLHTAARFGLTSQAAFRAARWPCASEAGRMAHPDRGQHGARPSRRGPCRVFPRERDVAARRRPCLGERAWLQAGQPYVGRRKGLQYSPGECHARGTGVNGMPPWKTGRVVQYGLSGAPLQGGIGGLRGAGRGRLTHAEERHGTRSVTSGACWQSG